MMDCANCQRLTDDLTSLTIAFKNLKKWMNEKLEIRIPQCLDFPVDNVQVGIDGRRLSHNISLPVCLEKDNDKRLVIRLERLPATTTTETQRQGSDSESSTDNEDMFNNGQNELRYDRRLHNRSILNQNNSGEVEDDRSINESILDLDNDHNFDNLKEKENWDKRLPSITKDQNRITCEKKPNLMLKTYSKSKVSNQVNSYKNRELKKDLFLEKPITTTNNASKKIIQRSYLIDDNYIEPPRLFTKTTLKRNQNLKCLICSKSNFSTTREYRLHLSSHDFSKRYKCSNCPARFSNKQLLKSHHYFCIGLKRYVCLKCKRRFTLECQVKRHNLLPCSPIKEKNNGPFQCPLPNCHQVYTSNHRLREHMKYSVLHRKHPPRPKPKKYKCEHCKLRISTPGALANHTKRCLKIKDILCTNCGKLFSCEKDLYLHVLRVHEKVKNKECPHCQKKFYSTTSVRKHIQSLHSTDPESFERICPTCGVILKNEDSLKKHISTVHQERRFKCELDGCNRTFSWENELKRHLKYHSEIKQGPFKCTFDDKCIKGFASQMSLQVHISRSHQKNNTRKDTRIRTERIRNPRKSTSTRECPICKKHIKCFSNNFKNHIRFTHEGYRPYKCSGENCTKTFSSKFCFGIHVKRHHPEQYKPEDFPLAVSNPNPKKYICKVKDCNRAFYHSSNLIQHQSVHLEIGEFSCNFCNLKFKRKYNVTAHIQAVHSGIKPFVCNYENCDNKSFALKYYLKSHISAVHLGKPRRTKKKDPSINVLNNSN